MSNKEKETIKLDALKLDEPIKGRPFPRKQAENMLRIQLKNGQTGWTISPSENKEFVDGEIRSIASQADSKSATKGK